MMRFLLKLSFVLLLLPFACKEKAVEPTEIDEIEIEENPLLANMQVNDWIYQKMKSYYFWEDEMKPLEETDLSLEPENYFNSILVGKGDVDRFSWIDESTANLTNSLNGLVTIFGFKYKAFYTDATRQRITFSITYSLKNSPAEKAGIKRGDFITKVNGEDLTLENYTAALNNQTVTLTMGSYNNGAVEDTKNTIDLTQAQIQTEALQYSDILELGGKKIGYFVYNQFLTSSDKAVNDMFGTFKNAAIDELIVDFRYNPGGYISSADMISSLIVKDLSTEKLMTRQVWNTEQMAGKPESNFDTYFATYKNSINATLNNPKTLNRVYFIVSNSSASASELVINNLKPYMKVILVGQHTYGKNVGSLTISDDKDPKRWQWGLQPIVLKSFNANGESDYGTKEGFPVDIEVNDGVLPFKAFGNPDETMLFAALSDILGTGTMSRISKKIKKTPTGKFEALNSDAIYGNPALDRKEMWVTELPWDRK